MRYVLHPVYDILQIGGLSKKNIFDIAFNCIHLHIFALRIIVAIQADKTQCYVLHYNALLFLVH